MENTEQITLFQIEENWRTEDPYDQTVYYTVKNDGGKSLLLVESHIELDEKINGFVINKVSIPVDPDEPELEVPATRMAQILATLADEGLLKPGKPVHLDNPGEYILTLEEPYKITSCYYQTGFDKEVDEWLQEFLVNEGTIARIFAIVDSEEEK